MDRRPYRSILLPIGLLVLIIFLVVWTPGQLYSASKESVATTFFNQIVKASVARPSPTRVVKRSVARPSPTAVATETETNTSFALTGSSVWILSCLDGWEKQKIYQTNPYYTNEQGIKKAKDIYVFGNFWLQPNTGTLWSYTENPHMLQCLSNLITTVHSQYHAHVCGVLGVQETSGGWKGSDVTAYTKRAVADPSLLTPIFEQVKKYPYDCLINDIEDGDSAHPETFTQYEALLHDKLPIPLGQTLIWKTLAVSAYWQKWENWETLANNADFFIVMALDHDSINTSPTPTSIVDDSWLQDIYTYMRSVPNLFGTHPIAWELPTYYRLYTQQSGTWAVSSGTDVQTQIATALSSNAILKNSAPDANNPYLEYTHTPNQMTYLFFETAASSDVLAQTLTRLNGSTTCLPLSFWDNDSGTSNSIGWSTTTTDGNVRLC